MTKVLFVSYDYMKGIATFDCSKCGGFKVSYDNPEGATSRCPSCGTEVTRNK